jgi:hypothetical protein
MLTISDKNLILYNVDLGDSIGTKCQIANIDLYVGDNVFYFFL